MGKWIALSLILLGGFGIYWVGPHKSPAYKTFLQWTTATNEGDCNTLYSIAEGDAKKWVDGFCTPVGGITVSGQTTSGMSAAAMVAELKNTPSGVMQRFHREIESENEAADGTVSLVVVESVLARSSNFSKPAPPRKISLKLREKDGVWKVLEFKDEDR